MISCLGVLVGMVRRIIGVIWLGGIICFGRLVRRSERNRFRFLRGRDGFRGSGLSGVGRRGWGYWGRFKNCLV